MNKTFTIRNLDSELYKKAKALAALQGMTIGQFVNKALAKAIKKGD